MQGKVTSKDSAATQVYIGIDVCKKWLDVFIHPVGQSARVENTAKGFRELGRMFAKFSVQLIVMEATGKLHRGVHRALHVAGFAVAVVNPLRARLFAEAAGALAKTDSIDARMLAIMGEALKPEAAAPLPILLENLQELMRMRQAAVDDSVALGNQIKATSQEFVVRELKRRQKGLAASIARFDRELRNLVKTKAVLERRYQIVLSIKGIGPVAAIALVVGLSELGSCTNKQAAMLAGLAPVARDSGDKNAPRHIKGGRGDVRRTIYMAARSAARHNRDLKRTYDRLIDKGKVAKVATVAVMRKLVTLANTLITQDRHWLPDAPQKA